MSKNVLKMSKKCLSVLVLSEKCQKNVPLQLAGKGLRRKMSKKCPTHMVFSKKCQKNVPRHGERQAARRRETRGRILTVSVTKNWCSFDTEKFSPMPPCGREPPVPWARPELAKVVGPVFGCGSLLYAFLVLGVLIYTTKKVMYIYIYMGSIQFGNDWYSASIRLVYS